MHKTLIFVIFLLHSSVFHYRIERFVKFDVVLHQNLPYQFYWVGQDALLPNKKIKTIFLLDMPKSQRLTDFFTNLGIPQSVHVMMLS